MNNLLILYAAISIAGFLFACYLFIQILKPEKEQFRKLPAKVNGKKYTYYTVLTKKGKPLICPN